MDDKERMMKGALMACRFRGHNMSEFETLTPTLFRSTCWDKRCEMEVDVNLKPKANQIHVGGKAVALTCKKETVELKVPSFGCPNCNQPMEFVSEGCHYIFVTGDPYQTYACKVEGCLVGEVVLMLKTWN